MRVCVRCDIDLSAPRRSTHRRRLQVSRNTHIVYSKRKHPLHTRARKTMSMFVHENTHTCFQHTSPPKTTPFLCAPHLSGPHFRSVAHSSCAHRHRIITVVVVVDVVAHVFVFTYLLRHATKTSEGVESESARVSSEEGIRNGSATNSPGLRRVCKHASHRNTHTHTHTSSQQT